MSERASASVLTCGRRGKRECEPDENDHRNTRAFSRKERKVRRARTHLHDPDDGSESLLRHDLHAMVDVDKDLRRDVGRVDLGEGEEGLFDERLGALRDCGRKRWGSVNGRNKGRNVETEK